MDPTEHVIPTDIEKPVPLLFWEPLEFVLSLCLMGFGIIAHLWVLGMASAAAVLIGSRYLKRGAKQGAMQHYLWSLGLQLDKPLSRMFPPAWKNDFTE